MLLWPRLCISDTDNVPRKLALPPNAGNELQFLLVFYLSYWLP